VSEGFRHRTAFGCWINDMRNQGMPGASWPHADLDEQAVQDITGCLELQSRAGFNEFDVFGLLVSYSWPLDLRSAVSEERRRRVKRILQAAHERGIKVLCGLGVYSWGFDEIIANDPAVRGPNPHAMCGSREESWQWMARVVDYILAEFDVDGFHLESSDLGRCTCAKCARQGDVQYHSGLNSRTAAYVRSKWPDKILQVNMCGYIQPWGLKVAPDELQYLLELGRHLDFLIDPGHSGFFMSEAMQRDFTREAACAFGTSGGIWVYPPQPWGRQRWFLPYTMGTGRHIKQLYQRGGRAIEYYMGPTINPGVEVNIAFGGRLLADPQRSGYEVLAEVLEELYRPGTPAALEKLVQIVQRAESAYFDNWTPVVQAPRDPPGELHLTTLYSAALGIGSADVHAPLYLFGARGTGMMTAGGRAAYRGELQGLLKEAAALEGRCDDGGRLARMQACMGGALADIAALE
jgi:hypothetical protein